MKLTLIGADEIFVVEKPSAGDMVWVHMNPRATSEAITKYFGQRATKCDYYHRPGNPVAFLEDDQ